MTQKNSDSRKYNIGVLTPPIETAGIIPLSNLMEILRSISNDLYLLTGAAGLNYFKNSNRINTYGINFSPGATTFTRIVKFIFFQINESRKIFGLSNKVTCWFFFFSAEFQLFPIIIARLCRKKVIIIVTGSSIKTLEFQDDYLRVGLKILSVFTCLFAKKIIFYSKNLIKGYNFEMWNKKILIAHRHFLDFSTFTVTTPYHDRPHLIGYIGRLSTEKGVQHFVQALPAILSNNQDLRVLIGGDGQLKEEIKDSLQEGRIADRVDLPGWISHDDLPKYLNQLRLLVLPSYTEGLPNIMLEAMACGTPVLATPVGAIPDVIRDGETGFIMEDNSPECIARNVLRALNDPDLEEVAERGRRFVEGGFTFEKAVERWRLLIEEIV